MMEQMISVVVATYNQEATISRTLDSILCQQCHVPLEIIIGEDCSTDGTRAVCEDYARRYPDTIRLISNEHNKGIIDNYFDCLLAARGAYIADCAGDDFWTDPLKLEKELCVMEQHPEVTMVITNWQLFDETTGQTRPSQQRQHKPVTPGRELLEAILTQTHMSCFHLCTSLYRTSMFREAYESDTYLFRNKDFGCEDIQVAFSMALRGAIAYLPDVTLNYSVGHPSASAFTDESRQFRFVRQVTSLSHYLARKHQLSIDGFLRQRLFALGMHAFRSHDPQLFLQVQTCKKEWNVKPTPKNRLLFFIMQHPWLWRLALVARQLFVSAKRLSH